MKNKISVKNITILLLISFVLSFVGEILIFNYPILANKATDFSLNVEELKDVEKTNEGYKTLSDDAEIVLSSDDKYIHELKFFYDSIADFEWEMEVLTKDNNTIITPNKSADIISLANRKIDENVSQITLKIHAKDVVLHEFTANNSFSFSIFRFLFFFVGSFLFFFLILNRKQLFLHLEKTFLIIILPLGFLLILFTPVSAYTSNDDQVHFHRAYTLFDGDSSSWSLSARYYDKLILNAPDRFRTQEEFQEYNKFLNENNTKSSSIIRDNEDATISYNELIYIPQALALKLGKIVGLPFTLTMYLAKIVNLLIYAILIYSAIKTIPIGKKIVFVLALLPTPVYLASQFSYDPSIIGSCILSISYFIKMLYSDKLKNSDYLKFVLGIVWASLAKAVYCPLLLLTFLLPKDKFETKEQATKIKILSLFFVFLFLSTYILPTLMGEVSGDPRVEGTSVVGQLKYILTNPISYLKIFTVYTWNNLSQYFFGYNALSQMGYLVTKNDGYFNLPIFITLMVLCYVIFTDPVSREKINIKVKGVFSFILVFIWCLVATALYLSWTPVGYPLITGVQGRYFLPVILLLIFVLKPTKRKNTLKEENPVLVVILPVLVLLFYLFYILMLLYR